MNERFAYLRLRLPPALARLSPVNCRERHFCAAAAAAPAVVVVVVVVVIIVIVSTVYLRTPASVSQSVDEKQ